MREYSDQVDAGTLLVGEELLPAVAEFQFQKGLRLIAWTRADGGSEPSVHMRCRESAATRIPGTHDFESFCPDPTVAPNLEYSNRLLAHASGQLIVEAATGVIDGDLARPNDKGSYRALLDISWTETLVDGGSPRTWTGHAVPLSHDFSFPAVACPFRK